MLQRGIVIVICFIYLLGTCVSLIPYLNYALNKEYIAANFCENKSKPEMHCNGKCFIGKEIKKLNEQQHSSNKEQQVQHNEIFPHLLQSETTICFFETQLLLSSGNLIYPVHICTEVKIDMPPEFLS